MALHCTSGRQECHTLQPPGRKEVEFQRSLAGHSKHLLCGISIPSVRTKRGVVLSGGTHGTRYTQNGLCPERSQGQGTELRKFPDSNHKPPLPPASSLKAAPMGHQVYGILGQTPKSGNTG